MRFETPLAASLPVEWVPWLALVGATFIAIGALVGVILSNKTTLKTSRQEREDARRRDFLQWRRDVMLRLGTEVVDAASEAIDEYSKVASLFTDPITPTSLEPVDRASRRIAATETLRLLGAYDAATRCIELRDMMLAAELMNAAKELHGALRDDRDAGLSYEQITEATKATECRFYERLRQVQVALRGFGQAAESELRQLNPPEPPCVV